MRVQSRQHLHQLTFLPDFFPVNCYLVEEEGELTLVDAALPSSTKGIISAATRIGKPITRIVLTHAHNDHVGSLDALKQHFPEVPVYISRRDARLLAGDVSLDPAEPNVPVRGGIPSKLHTRPNILLEEGDVVGSLQAVSSPGHTPGSMAFMDTRTGALLAGDAFVTRGRVAVAGRVVPLFPFPALATWHKETAWHSARKLQEMKPSLLAVGHGPMIDAPQAAIQEAVEDFGRRLGI